MADVFGDPLEFEVVLASLRLGREDAESQLADLAGRLDRALPDKVDIGRSGLLSKKVRSLSVDLAGKRYRIEASKGELICSIASVVRDVVIRTDECTVDSWLSDLARELVRAADASQDARAALERLLR